MMTEHEAWVSLVKWFENTMVLDYGICCRIRNMAWHNEIDQDTKWAMLNRVMDRKPKGKTHEDYFWPLTHHGKKERIKFCKLMAEETKDAI